MLPNSSATRSAITRFSEQVWTNSRYFWRFSKKRKFPVGSRFSIGGSGTVTTGTPSPRKACIRSSVSTVMRLPSRSRCTSLPSFTARRPNVDSAIPACRQYSEIWARSWSFFIRPVGRVRVGWNLWAERFCVRLPTTICPQIKCPYGTYFARTHSSFA